jgi:hypothetical protein
MFLHGQGVKELTGARFGFASNTAQNKQVFLNEQFRGFGRNGTGWSSYFEKKKETVVVFEDNQLLYTRFFFALLRLASYGPS